MFLIFRCFLFLGSVLILHLGCGLPHLLDVIVKDVPELSPGLLRDCNGVSEVKELVTLEEKMTLLTQLPRTGVPYKLYALYSHLKFVLTSLILIYTPRLFWPMSK